jgi:hypothetical protein
MLSRRLSLTAVAIGFAMAQFVLSVPAFAGINHGRVPQWRVEVNPIDAGGSRIAPEFKIAIYENLVTELNRAKQFSAVLRGGDSSANGVSNLLTLKTTVESYDPGSETKRAVTTVTGATKLRVRSQLCTKDGQVVLERVVNGNVRFFGGNLRATHNLARNVANAFKHATLPEPLASEPTRAWTVFEFGKRRVSSDQADSGTANRSMFLESEASVLSAQADLLRAEYDRSVATADLARVSGNR